MYPTVGSEVTDKNRGTGLLKTTLFVLMVIPSYMVFQPIGATGNVPHLLALLLFLTWVLASGFGLHDPMRWGHPGRLALAIWLMATMASYVAMYAGFSGWTDVAARAAADRWVLLLLAGAGVTVVTTEAIRSMEEFKHVVRWLMAGAFVCAIVAIIQFFVQINPMEWISSLLVGFVDNNSGNAFQERDGFLRVSGTTMHPIELAVVSSMLLPLSIWWGLFDKDMGVLRRIAVPTLLFASNVLTISRTGMIGLVIGALILIPYLPKFARRWALVVAPAGMVVFFLTVPGMISTLFFSATAGSADSSITYRTDDYPLAWQLFIRRPFLGQGPGSWLPSNLKDVFDNQYILTVTTLGGIGLLALLVYLLVPTFATLVAAHHATTQESRTLGAALASAMMIATVSAGTFDAMVFQTFALILPFFIGAGGFLWHHVQNQLLTPPFFSGELPVASSSRGKNGSISNS